jgi:hypothetical protein
LDSRQDGVNYEFEVSPSGELSYTPFLITGKSMLFLGNISVKLGDVTSCNVSLTIGRDIRAPVAYSQKILLTDESFTEDNLPTPAGLNIDIEPKSFLVYPGVQYLLSLNISTSSNLKPGTYYLKFENFLNGDEWMVSHSRLTIDE